MSERTVIGGERRGSGRQPETGGQAVPDVTDRLRMDVADDGGCRLVRVSGELDVAEADHCRELLLGVGRDRTVVDLSELTFLDVRGLSALVDTKRELSRRGVHVALVGARGVVRRLFERSGLSAFLGP